jgi:hypothetical protein
MPAPSFVCIIGAQRSGTTWLYHMLDAHPDIRMARPVVPEPKFFLDALRVAEGREAYLATYFPEGLSPLIGEKGTSYIEHPEVRDRIRGFFPDARIIAILRHPVARALSNYHFSRGHGVETRSLREVFLHQVAPPPLTSRFSVSPFSYLERGDYSVYLRPFLTTFGDAMKVLVFEEVVGNGQALNELYAWLGVPTTPAPSAIAAAVNASEQDEDDEVDAEVLDVLHRACAPMVQRTEDLLGRSIPAWHDHG